MNNNKKFNITIFTDGSCKPNPGNGGYAAILKWGYKKNMEIFGGEKNTTNNRMELTAVLKALAALLRPCNVTLYTDSEYVMRAVNGIAKPKKNEDMLIHLKTLLARHEIKVIWVKGHSMISENERCDFLAKREADRLNAR